MRPRLALVPGEPAGVGPELCIRAAQRRWDADITVFADRRCLQAAADALGLPVRFIASDAQTTLPGDIRLVEVSNAEPSVFGRAVVANGAAVISALNLASDACLRGEFDGIVTGPTHKATINAAGFDYTGTTEWLAQRAGVEVVMMLANDIVRVALATTHLPLRQVPEAITGAGLTQVLQTTHRALRQDFGIEQPRIAVLGLNPHAGEAGLLGREELEVIEPALDALRAQGMQLIGPLPADTAFLPQKLAGFDAVLAMYHDQGLPTLKYSGFERAVNLTLGLPYPRVAVDHGTALDLAGSGKADPSSLYAAIESCARIAALRRKLHA